MLLMSSAPKDRIIEVLFDDMWIEAYWSDRAYDGSPYGAAGWAQVDGDYYIDGDPSYEIQAWRPVEVHPYGLEESPLQGHRPRQPIVVLGLGFGDEAKGATVDYLSSTIPDAAAVVRWSGGANAAHNVRHGHREHTFRQFGSGSFLGLPTFLTEDVVINLEMLMEEAVQLEALGVNNPLGLIVLNSESLITTPIHSALNRAREILRGLDRHGSCGVGLGETIVHGYAERNGLNLGDSVGNFEIPGPTANGEGVLTAGDLSAKGDEGLHGKVLGILEAQALYARFLIEEASAEVPELSHLLDYGPLDEMAQTLISVAGSLDILTKESFYEELQSTMLRGTVIFEGSQGLLLDEQWGFHPHTTWSQIEPSRLMDWLQEFDHRPYVLGLTRSYSTRHGAGPLPSFDSERLHNSMVPADDNDWGRWQGDFRVAPLDLPLLSYASEILLSGGLILDGLAVSHLDAFDGPIPVVDSYGEETHLEKSWSFATSAEGPFPTMNSDEFIAQPAFSEPSFVDYRESQLLEAISARFSDAPVVLSARGPKRTDRELLSQGIDEEKEETIEV